MRHLLRAFYIIVVAATPHGARAMEENERSERLIFLAEKGTRWDVFEHLKTCGAKEVNYEDRYHRFALALLAERGWFELMELLIKKGANVNKASSHEKWTALHHAIESAPEEFVCKTVEMLLKYGADPNIENLGGETPFAKALAVYVPFTPDLIKLFFNPAVNTIKPDVTKKAWLGCSPLSWVLIDGDFPFETVKLLVENGVDVDEQIDVWGTKYTPAEYARKFGQKEEFPDYPTMEMADYLDAASLKKKLDIGIKKNISGKELQAIAHKIKKFDKAFCRSFAVLVYFKDNFDKIPQELWCRFDPANAQTGAKGTEKKSDKIIKPDLTIHFYKCPCLLCGERKARLLSLVPTRRNALVPYNQAAVAGLLGLKK